MNFVEFVKNLDILESISSRNDMVKKLAELFTDLLPEEARVASYLLLGELHPPYIGTQFGIAEKTMISAFFRFASLSEDEVKKKVQETGDLGTVIAAAPWKKATSRLSIQQMYDELVSLEQISGGGSQSEKVERIIKIFSEITADEAKYITRIILGKLRLGFSDMTILDAVSWKLVGSKKAKDELENAYNMCTDIGRIVEVALSKGLEGIKSIQIEAGIPIRPAAAERLDTSAEIIEKIGSCVAQPKLDGFRVQIHIQKKPKLIKFFSRHLTDISQMFPDLIESLLAIKADSLIFEGEAIGFNPETGDFLPFQETVKRRRKHGIEEAQAEYPLKLFLFDLLYYDGKSYIEKPHKERRKILESLFKGVDPDSNVQCIEEKKASSAKELEDYFLHVIEQGLEGLVVKKPDSVYQAGKRNFNWIKLKRSHKGSTLSDTIDTVIIGYYYGHGKRAKFGIGALLVAVYNHKKDLFETIAKLGTGFSDEQFIATKKRLDVLKVAKKPVSVVCPKELEPDVWVNPELVCEVYADEVTRSPLHTTGKTSDSSGYALRFPRFLKYRDDKGALEATTTEEIVKLYKKSE